MFTSTRILTFDDFSSSHDIPLREHYSYLQLRHFLQQLIKSWSTPYNLTPFESLCRARPHSLGLISLIYSSIISSKKNTIEVLPTSVGERIGKTAGSGELADHDYNFIPKMFLYLRMPTKYFTDGVIRQPGWPVLF